MRSGARPCTFGEAGGGERPAKEWEWEPEIPEGDEARSRRAGNVSR